MTLKLKCVAAAAAALACLPAFATDLGTWTPGESLAYASAMSGAFTQQLSFTLLADGADFSGVVSSSYSGTGLIRDFAATLAGPDGYRSAWDYTLQSAPRYQLLTDGADTLAAGTYTLTVSGIGLARDSYTVDMSISPVPEPGTLALVLAGFSAMAFVARRRRTG